MLAFAVILLAAYLIGGIPFGYLVARSRGVDILKQGSGNIGATNVGRVLGFRFGLLVFVLDFAKGALPVVGAKFMQSKFMQSYFPIEPTDLLRDDWLRHGLVEVAAGLLAFLGHLLPVYLGFRGGKGVATGAGVVAVLVPLPALYAVGTWVLFTSATRYISLASVVAATVMCLSQLAMTSFAVDDPRNWFCVLAAALVLVRHRSNLMRLVRGTENRLPASEKLDWLAKALHLLAVALWFGGSLFFTFVVALQVFNTAKEVTQLPAGERPWLPRPAEFAKSDEVVDGPKEQALRLAGTIVGGIFPSYFMMQLVCGLIALVPALAWRQCCPTERMHRWRCGMLLAGLLLVLCGFWLEHKVHEARGPRNEAIEAYLKNQSVSEKAVEEMKSARMWFGIWHGISVLVNYGAIALVAGVLLMAVNLPAKTQSQPEELDDGNPKTRR